MKKRSSATWFVYMLRCADNSLYTGIAEGVIRRCRQHNQGTAARYTRCRLPVEVIYQEAQPSQGSALRREAAIKTMRKRDKEALIRLASRSRRIRVREAPG